MTEWWKPNYLEIIDITLWKKIYLSSEATCPCRKYILTGKKSSNIEIKYDQKVYFSLSEY